MRKGKKDKGKSKTNNRLLYTLISLGILIIIAGGAYAIINPATDAYHSADKINFTGVEINPSKVTTDTLCIGENCKTAWPTGTTGNACPDGASPYYVYSNNGEDTLGSYTHSTYTTETCGTSITSEVTDASSFCSISAISTCEDIYAIQNDDDYGAWNSTYNSNICNTWANSDTCGGTQSLAYTCSIGEVKDCFDYKSGMEGACWSRQVQCRNQVKTVTCRADSEVRCLSD